MRDLHDLSLAHDGPIAPHEYMAARYGHHAHARITVGSDMAVHHRIALGFTRCIKKLGRNDPAFGRLLANARWHMAQWRKLRGKYREIMRESEWLNTDMERGLYRAAAE